MFISLLSRSPSSVMTASRRANSVRRRSVMSVEMPHIPSTLPSDEIRGTFLARKSRSPEGPTTRSSAPLTPRPPPPLFVLRQLARHHRGEVVLPILLGHFPREQLQVRLAERLLAGHVVGDLHLVVEVDVPTVPAFGVDIRSAVFQNRVQQLTVFSQRLVESLNPPPDVRDVPARLRIREFRLKGVDLARQLDIVFFNFCLGHWVAYGLAT